MEKIRPQRRHLEANQEPDWMSRGVSTILRIPRSANSPRGIDDQSTMEATGSFIFEEGCINSISDLDTLVLAVFFISSFARASISFRFEILREITYVIV